MTSSHSRGSALQKNMLSSTNNEWDTEGLARATRIPVIFHWLFAWFRRLTNASVHKMKMKGNKGYPWRKPLWGTMFPLGWPFLSTWYFTNETMCMIHLIQFSEKPHFFHYSLDKDSLHPIIFLTHISHNRHHLMSSTWLCALSMKYFLRDHNVITNLLSRHKGWLCFWYPFRYFF